ncbi:MAG: uroporphyrinogen-III synthase [Polyangiaceae bacterium]|nr:uroporphyrinogen-III synthase [Polyangiaceae bacterium]
MGHTGGRVSFVDLGPGDPALRTERASERMASADIVVDDDDVPIEKLLELGDLAKQGQRVVRVVRGDGSGPSGALAEAAALAQAGVAIEIVPGVAPSAMAAAFAGVLARAVYISASEVAGAVRAEGPSAPVTIVHAAGAASQRIVVTTAAAAADEARVFGDARVVVAFGAPEPALRWFERLPLFGKRVLVTRAREQAGSTASLLRDLGADPWVVPTIHFRPPADAEPLARALRALRAGEYGWAAFTSANGVERTWDALVAMGGDARAFGGVKLAAIGPATARALEARSLRPDVVAKEFRGESLAAALIDAAAAPASRVLLARAAKARDVLPDTLRAAGHAVDVVAAYETHPPSVETGEALAAELERGRVDAVTFTSSSTVEHLCDLLGPRAASLLGRALVASIGPVTTATATGRGVRVDVTAREYTVAGLIAALAASYAGRAT